MDGYDSTSYGAAFADVYDEWYRGVSDVPATVDLVAGLAGGGGRVLELGVGTGRLALPLAARGLQVVGIDTSAAMLDRLAAADTAGEVTAICGDMVDDLPDGPFDVVLVAYNTLFNLPNAARQEACFHAVRERLADRGAFVVEAFVPDEPFRRGDAVELRSMTAEQVVLSVSRHVPEDQQASGHFVELTNGAPVKLRPWSIRYATVAQLDAMAARVGLRVADRWADASGARFDDDSSHHVSVYVPETRTTTAQNE